MGTIGWGRAVGGYVYSCASGERGCSDLRSGGSVGENGDDCIGGFLKKARDCGDFLVMVGYTDAMSHGSGVGVGGGIDIVLTRPQKHYETGKLVT